jgi:hypothetical protein
MDISWIIEQEKLEKIQKKCVREPFSTIELVSIYTNQSMEIETIEKDTMEIEENQKVLDTDILKEWSIQKQKHTPKSTFVLNEILWFHIDLEPEQIQTIDEHKSYLQNIYSKDKHTSLGEIKLTPAIFIFHSLTTLFFLFHEETKLIHQPNSNSNPKKIDKKKRTLRIVLPSKYKNSVRITRKEKPMITNISPTK